MNDKERKTDRWDVEFATERDIPSIISVEEHTWISSYPNGEIGITESDIKTRFDSEFKKKRADEMRGEMSDGNHSYRVILENGKVIAYSHLLKEEEFNDLVEIYVLPEYQGKGIGGTLMRDAMDWFGNDKPIRLEVATYNPAIAIYEHYGFERRPDLQQAKDEVWNVLPLGKRIPIVFMERPSSNT